MENLFKTLISNPFSPLSLKTAIPVRSTDSCTLESDLDFIDFVFRLGRSISKEERKRKELLLTPEIPFTGTHLQGSLGTGDRYLMSGERRGLREKKQPLDKI
jgi:D-alanine-D-alanine ligase-like ATP-grasp enzyme